jgi:hypothetical protein
MINWFDFWKKGIDSVMETAKEAIPMPRNYKPTEKLTLSPNGVSMLIEALEQMDVEPWEQALKTQLLHKLRGLTQATPEGNLLP